MTADAAWRPSPVAPVEGPRRPALVRPQQGRLVGGVAAGLAAHLGRPVQQVRVVLAVATLVGGAGAVLYVWLWALAPSREQAPTDVASPVSPSVAPGTSVTPSSRGATRNVPSAGAGAVARVVVGDVLLGCLLLVAGGAVLAARLGYGVRLEVTLPVLVVLAGTVLAYSQLDEVERSHWRRRAGVGRRAAVLRVLGGVVLVLVGVLLLVVQRTDLADAGRVLFSTAAVLAGAGIVLAPWAVRLWRDLDAERAARVREAERADMAAHLHDSVLQTLALVQRHSADPAQVTRLARAQERDLRAWLYGPRAGAAVHGSGPAAGAAAVAGQDAPPPTLAGHVQAAAADVEDLHGVAVEVVVVGDRPADERVAVLVAALREAVLNAARHAGAPVQVYVESGPDAVEAFVRDRGPGFDLASVPPDRLGVRESVVGRMVRAGGTAVVRSTPGEGTEVRLRLPDPRTADGVPGATTGRAGTA